MYKGNGAQMVRIFPYAATQFTAFELYKKVKDCFLTCGSLRKLSSLHLYVNYEGWNFNSGNTALETLCNGTK